jgi:hypothetical protein
LNLQKLVIHRTTQYKILNKIQLFRFASLYGLGREICREVYFDGRREKIRNHMITFAENFPLIHDKIHIKVKLD